MKKTKKSKGIVKGAPSGFVISLMVHAAAFLLAGMLVVFTVAKKEEKKFIPPKPVDRPKMKLKKPKVKVKKTSKPKATTRIVTKVKKASMPDIQLPEMSGMGDALAGGIGGFEIMPDLGEISLFGSSQSIGSDFEGRFYSLKYDRRGGGAIMDPEKFLLLIRKFCTQGWRESILAPYYRAPEKLYTTHFMVPPIPSPMAPDVFGQPEMESYWFFVKYEDQLVYPEDIRFRFWGIGDAYIVVNVDGENVLVNGVEGRLSVLDFWQSTEADNDKYFLGDKTMKIGDWISLKAGQPVDMQVLYGEYAGGIMGAMLLVEVEGVDYPQTRQGGPLLPAFKTSDFSLDQLEQIRKYLPEGEASLTNGPVFRDYIVSDRKEATPDKSVKAEQPAEVEPSGSASEMRLWSLKNGKTQEAQFVALIGGKVTLKTGRGRQLKLDQDLLSDEDLKYIDLMNPPELRLNFSKTSKQRLYDEPLWVGDEGIPKGIYYDFRADISQKSPRNYPYELTAEFFAIAEEIDGDKRILLDHQKESFYLTEGSRSIVEITGKRVELSDYVVGGVRRGERYEGFLIVVTDSRGEIIAHKATSENLFTNLDNLRNVPVGKYFDENCNRCQPTRAKRFY